LKQLSYILATLQDLREQEGIRVDRVPLVRALLGVDVGPYLEALGPSTPRHGKKSTQRTPSHARDLEKDVLRHKNQTVVTTRVGRIAKHLFELTLRIAGQEDIDDVALTRAIRNVKAHHADPTSIVWLNAAATDGYFNSVLVDGVVYKVRTAGDYPDNH
jgi:DNA (cytosine-5)-methyltransferase 1